MLESRGGSSDGARMSFGLKEGAARAVLRDAWQHGHDSIELLRDGRRVIFFCTLCSTRCYSDAALSDHLNGNQHSRHAAVAAAESTRQPTFSESPSTAVTPQYSGDFTDRDQFLPGLYGTAEKDKNHSMIFSAPVNLDASASGSLPPSSIECVGLGQLFLREAFSGSLPQVKAAWCSWVGQNSDEPLHLWHSSVPEEAEFAVIIFPYSEAIGRSGNWRPVFRIERRLRELGQKSPQWDDWRNGVKKVESHDAVPQPLGKDSEAMDKKQSQRILEDLQPPGPSEESTQMEADEAKLLSTKHLSNRALRRALKKQRVKALERLCFICHQQMLPGKDVAALLNIRTGQMMCSSRNRRGAFHVFHTSCLIDWVLLCGVKFRMAPIVGPKTQGRRMRGQINGKQHKTGSKVSAGSNVSIFCPECQGTGANSLDAQLEHPRYRLAQVFEWILELIQARKAWMDHYEQLQKGNTGLLFCSDKDLKGAVLPVGLLYFYGAGSQDVPATSALMRKTATSDNCS